MKILMIYATYSSGTLYVSQMIQEQLQNGGHDVTLLTPEKVNVDDLQNYDVITLGSPSWWNRNQDGQPHHEMLNFMDKLQGKTLEKKFAVYGLGDSSYARLCHAVDVMDDFVKNLKGNLVMDSLKVDSFYFDRPHNEELIHKWTGELLSKLS
jgi:flavodoxin